MSKEEFLKIQTCVLKVNIHCDGCKQKVKKILQKIDGVFTTKIDAEAGKVTVSGNVDAAVLIKKLAKSGKHAELWGAPKPNNNLPNPFKNMQIDNAKAPNNNKKGNNHPQHNQPPKGGPPNQNQQFQQQLQQLQQLQQMKGLQDLKLPQFKGMKLPNEPQNNNQKAVRFADDEDLSEEYDDDFDDEDDDDDDMYDDEFDDEIYDQPLHNKMKPNMGNGNGHGLPPAIQNMINAQKGVQNNGAANAKKGGPPGAGNGIPIPVQNMGAGGKNGNGAKNGGGNNNNNPQGGKNGGGKPQEGKNGNIGGKNGNGGGGGGGNGNNMQGHGGKKGSNGGQGGGGMNDGFPKMGGPQGQMGNMNIPPMGQMGNMPMGQLGSMAAVQGLPASINGGGGGGGAPNGYFQGAGPDPMPGNPYHQQQYLAAMMNQQRAMGNERFQPMMYARPPPAVNYMPPYPYPYPHPHPHTSDPYTNFFSDENTSSCSVM